VRICNHLFTNLRFVIYSGCGEDIETPTGPVKPDTISGGKIDEVLVPIVGDDGAAVLWAVCHFLCPGNLSVVLLLPSSLMPRAKAAAQRHVSAVGEQCPHCHQGLSDDWMKAAHSRVAGRAGGRPRRLRLCPFCRREFSTRELREHLPHCSGNPKWRAG
jgi:hypothetical protein